MKISNNQLYLKGIRYFIFLFIFRLNSNGFITINTHTSNCSGTDISCKGNSLNSVGDLVIWNTKGIPTVAYGEIVTTKSINVSVNKNYDRFILTFSPKQDTSLLNGDMIRVLFVFISMNGVLPKDLPQSVVQDISDIKKNEPNANTFVGVYRQIINPKQVVDKSEWVNVALVGTMEKIAAIKQIKGELSPVGVATVILKDPNDTETPLVINLAKEY